MTFSLQSRFPPRPIKNTQQLFSRADVKHQFERFSSQKVGANAMPLLMDISERFCHKFIKKLNQKLESEDRSILCLADMKSLMEVRKKIIFD